MNDPPVSTLAIAEKRPQRPGGCVGIFFQLFDWNRRMAKKKLFSKKLLPPVRAKRLSKRFDGDEKLPTTKLLLIADENRGGFPNAKRSDIDGLCSSNDPERNNGMRTPSLVARLMGLDSMPAVRRDKPKKPSVPEFYNDQEKKSTKDDDNHGKTPDLYCYDQDSNSEKGQAKADLRPQKLQKTGFFDRRPVTKFGAEALQFKSVLSRSRKQHHQKLASPVKSPRILSGRNAARLMEAATKILEPGLQATNRAKCSLTYSGSPHLSMEHRASIEGADASFSKQSRQPTYPFGAKSLKVQSSCNSCGNLLDVVDLRSSVEERDADFASSTSDFSNTSSHGSGKSKVEPSEASIEQERDADSGRSVFVKGQEDAVSLAVQGKANLQRRNQNIVDRKPHLREDQNQSMPSRQRKPQRAVPLNALKQNNQRQNQMLVVKDKVAHKPKSCSRQIRSDPAANAYGRAKDYVALNKNLSNLTNRTRLPAKVLDNCRMDMERNACSKRDDSSLRVKTLARKRRPITSNPTVENTGFSNSNFVKQQSVRSDVSRVSGAGFNGRAVNRSSVKTGSWKLMEGNGSSSSKDADIVSFAFSSPMGHDNTGSFSAEMEKREGRGEVQSNVIPEAKSGNSSSLRASDFKGDALGALLEEKLRELTCSGRDEMEMGDSLAGRSTASILQELISALSMVKPISQGNGNNRSDGLSSKGSLCNGSPDQTFFVPNHGQVFDTNRKLKTEAEVALSARFLFTPDSDHPSPTSILEASFSNDSCFSGSLDGSSGHKLHHTSMGCLHHLTQPAYPDSELSDSATSMDAGAAKTEKITSCIDKISRACSINPAEIGLTGSMLNYARDVIVYAELLFGNIALYDADGMGDSVIETLAFDLCSSPECGLEFADAKEGGLLRRFLFDCMIEFLDSKYSQYCNLGFQAWSKLPLFLSRHKLAKQVHEEIRQWGCMGGNILDEIVEREMNYSMQKWADFKVETFEVGREIEGDILQILLDEVALDLWQCY